MKRLLALSTLPVEGPSVRPRVLAYEAALAAAEIDLDFAPFLGSRGFRGFYSTRPLLRARRILVSLGGYARRLRDLGPGRPADGVLVHREIVPRGNRRATRRLLARGLKIAYDLDDAIYMSPRDFVGSGEASRKRMSRLKDPGEVVHMMKTADLVLAGNETIAEFASGHCDDVRVQPTPVDTDLFRPRPREERHRPLVGWVGSPTAAYCLKDILPALERAAREVPFDLMVVGAGEPIRADGIRVIDRDWALHREAEDFASLDVGLYPIPDNDWTRGKCGMKALQYQASGVPGVVSPVGVNRRIVADGETGFFARTPGEWTDRLLAYLRDPDLRAAHAARGRETVESTWSLRALTPGFVAAMKAVTG